MRNYITVLLFISLLTACNTSQKLNTTATTPEPISQEEKAINNVVNKVYSSFKVDSKEQPDFEYIKTLFTPNGTLGFVRNDTLVSYSIDEYLSNMKTGFTKNKISLLKEWEIKGETEYFGNIAHRISTYGVYVNTTDKIAERGIISFQLVKTNGKWLVLSMIWNAENPKLKIPAKYEK